MYVVDSFFFKVFTYENFMRLFRCNFSEAEVKKSYLGVLFANGLKIKLNLLDAPTSNLLPLMARE